MTLTPEERTRLRTKALELITEKWPEPRLCPICNSNSWNVSDAVAMPLIYTPLEGPVLVYVPVNCQICAYTIFFDALAMGFFEDDPEGIPPAEFK